MRVKHSIYSIKSLFSRAWNSIIRLPTPIQDDLKNYAQSLTMLKVDTQVVVRCNMKHRGEMAIPIPGGLKNFISQEKK